MRAAHVRQLACGVELHVQAHNWQRELVLVLLVRRAALEHLQIGPRVVPGVTREKTWFSPEASCILNKLTFSRFYDDLTHAGLY